MAAFRQFLNGRGYAGKDDTQSITSPTAEDNSKMQSMNYSISPPLPQKNPSQAPSSKYNDQQAARGLHSKFNDVDTSGWTHPALRKHAGSDEPQDHRSNSFDQDRYRPAPLRSATTDNLPNRRSSAGGFEMDQSSLYEDNESPALSPALNKHLALRPLEVPDGRRRSRSVTEDDRYYGNSSGNNANDQWDGYGKDTSKQPPGRKTSVLGTSKPLPDTKESRAAQLLKDRQRPPTRQDSISQTNKHLPNPNQILTQQTYQGRYDPHPRSESRQGGATKVAQNPSADTSPTESVDHSMSDVPAGSQNRSRNLKRSRDCDYSIHQLADMSYEQLKDESFDHVPGSSKTMASFDLPNPSLPLSDRLQHIYQDKTHKDRELRARGFFSSLTIDQYEDCGDLLLDGFRIVMEKLKNARQQKRRAAKIMEEQITKREELVRKKRGIIEQDLGRLKSAGSAVVKPTRG